MTGPNIENLSAEDFQPMTMFPLRWRFMEDRKWNLLPDMALAQIHCFQPAKAAELERYCRRFVDRYALDAAQFASVAAFNASGAAEEGRAWLRERPAAADTRIFIVWNTNCAVLTTWGIFCDYWDDFCYPISDDVLVWPPSEEWVLFYGHHEALQFGQKQA